MRNGKSWEMEIFSPTHNKNKPSNDLLFRLRVISSPRGKERDIHRFVRKNGSLPGVFGNRRLKEMLIVALRKFRFVVSTARFISIECSQRYNPRQLKHVVQVSCVR